MKSKLILISICLLFITNAFSQETYYYIEGEKHYLTNISTKRILIGFEDNLTIFEKNDIIKNANYIVNSFSKKGDIIRELDYDKEKSSNDQYIMTLAKKSDRYDVIKLVETLRDNDGIKYANYFYYDKKDGGEMHSYSDRIIVKLKPDFSDVDIINIAEEYKFKIVEKKPLDELYENIYVLKPTNKIDAATLSGILWETGIFVYAEPSIISILKPFSVKEKKDIQTVDDEYRSEQWGLDLMNIDEYWENTTGNPFINIAILDNGVDLDHPDLFANLLEGYDLLNEGTGGGYMIQEPGPIEVNDHGTMCAGCCGAKGNNGEGIAGIAYDCSVIPVRISTNEEDENNPGETILRMSWEDVADWIRYSSQDADIISLSVGRSDGELIQVVKNAIDYITEYGRDGKGTPVVVAAGNEHDFGHTVCFPANLYNTIAVGNITQDLCREETSCYTDGKVDLSAPGKDIVTTTIDGQYTNGSNTVTGTSFSAPYVAGIIALMLSADNWLTYSEIKELLLTNCVMPEEYEDDATIVDEYGWWHEEVGHGYPNAEAILHDITGASGGSLNVSLYEAPNSQNPKKIKFTAYCEDCSDDLTYYWSINTVEGDLDGPCRQGKTGCVTTTDNPTQEIPFPDYGHYYVYVYVSDEEGNWGEASKILGVIEHPDDPCIYVNFDNYWSGPECVETYEVGIGEYQLVDYLSVPCTGNIPGFPYTGIKAVKWYIDDALYSEEIFTYKYEWHQPHKVFCKTFTESDIGEHTITLKAWAGYSPWDDNIYYVDEDNAYSSISKEINIVNTEETLNIDKASWENQWGWSWYPFLNYGYFNINPYNEDMNIWGGLFGHSFNAYHSIIIKPETIIQANPISNVLFRINDLPPNCNCYDKNLIASHGPNPSNIYYVNNDNSENKYRQENKNKGTTFVIESPENNEMTEIETQDYLLEDFEVIPNPFNNTFELVFSENITPERFEIISTSGNIIYNENLLNVNKKRVNTKSFSSGVYFIRLYTNNKILYKKIIKQ